MDSFAALALATEPPGEHLLEYPPQGQKERLITRTMFKNMVGHAVFQNCLLLWLTLSQDGSRLFGLAEHGGVAHYTVVFTTFVLLQARGMGGWRRGRGRGVHLQHFARSDE